MWDSGLLFNLLQRGDYMSTEKDYVVEGAELRCSLGSKNNRLKIPDKRTTAIGGKKRATVNDYKGGENIMSFGSCRRSYPPPSCVMGTCSKWMNGKGTSKLNGEEALQKESINVCSCGGIISIVDTGH